jgi:hypothetical protein
MALILNGSSGISGVDGTIGNPALIGSDPDTGIRFSTGEVSASINGVSGNVALIREAARTAAPNTEIVFTGIPSWVRRLTVAFSTLSLNGSGNIILQLGTSVGIETTGYNSSANYLQGGVASGGTNSSFGIVLFASNAINQLTGSVVFNNISGNLWVATGMWNYANSISISTTGWTAGDKTLSSALNQLRINSSNAGDAFDSGIVNIIYE